MTYVVNDKCIMCKHTDCVDVCPVDCFYEGENMLVINPDECIDCGVCEPECPANAILSDQHRDVVDHPLNWVDINANYSKQWPNITRIKDPLPDADSWNPNEKKGGTYKGGSKMAYLSDKPGDGS